MSQYVAAIDQGTTSTRCMIFDHGGQGAAVEQLEHEQIFPKAGWVEPDLRPLPRPGAGGSVQTPMPG